MGVNVGLEVLRKRSHCTRSVASYAQRLNERRPIQASEPLSSHCQGPLYVGCAINCWTTYTHTMNFFLMCDIVINSWDVVAKPFNLILSGNWFSWYVVGVNDCFLSMIIEYFRFSSRCIAYLPYNYCFHLRSLLTIRGFSFWWRRNIYISCLSLEEGAKFKLLKLLSTRRCFQKFKLGKQE